MVEMDDVDGRSVLKDGRFYGKAPYEVRKINKRLVVVDSTGKTIYAMPFWVQVTNRVDMQWLVDRFNEVAGYDIDAIIEFETKHSKVRKRNARR